MRDVCGVRYTVEAVRPDRKVQLQLLPMTGLRDFHAERHGADQGFKAEASERGVRVTNGYDALHVASDNGRFVQATDWWYGQVYPIETDSGQDDAEDLVRCPAHLVLEATGSASITLWMSVEPEQQKTPAGDWNGERNRRKQAVMAPAGRGTPENVSAGISSPDSFFKVGGDSCCQGILSSFRKSPDGTRARP